MQDAKQLSAKVDAAFQQAFGRTPLDERLADVLTQATDLRRFTDMRHLREQAGDLLCATLQLCTECGWDPADLVDATLAKVRARLDQYQALGRKLSVAILGGAFDPPTLGHVALAKAVLDHSGFIDEVWLTPCYAHMYGKQMVSPDHRLAMCRLASQADRRVRAFDFEIRHQLRGETYAFVKRLLSDEPLASRCDFAFIIGQDNANTFDRWVNAAELERMIRFVVVPRPGIPAPGSATAEGTPGDLPWYARPPHAFIAKATGLIDTSSTVVRGLLAKGDPAVTQHVDAAVLAYIQSNNLYR